MSQPSGMVCDFPSKYNFVLRSSPIICLLDTVFVIGRLARYTVALKSPRAAIEKIARHGFQDVADQAEESSLASLQKNTPFRLCVFMFGALPQTIKLYGIRGLPWTKVWGSMFLGSFLVNELLVLASKRSLRLSTPDQLQTSDGASSSSLDLRLVVGALFASLIFCIYFISRAFMSPITQYIGEKLRLHARIVQGTLLVEPWLLLFPPRKPLVAIALGLVLPLVMIFFTVSLPIYFNTPLIRSSFLRHVPYMLLKVMTVVGESFWSILAFGLSIFNNYRRFQHLSPGQANFVNTGLWLQFLLLNTLAALFYYKFKYNPEGTLKPTWTDQLG